MGSNQESCAVRLSTGLSCLVLGFLVFVAYYSSFFQKHEGSNGQHTWLLVFVMASCALELGSILINKSLQSKYWEQEVIAIKKAYSNSKQGIRSTNAQAKGNTILKAKHQKQVILRSLQLDMVGSYLIKTVCLCLVK